MIKCLLVVAMPSEARPLIDHFKLKMSDNSACRVYSAGQFALLQTGIGKLNAAGATAAVLGRLAQQQGLVPVCLNVGLAGAGRPLGSLLTAHSVCDQGSGKKWFPQLAWQSGGHKEVARNTVALVTVDQAETQYKPDIAYDMEAAGVFASASKFTTLEFIQSIKVVSDNQDQPLENINKTLAGDLINAHRDAIEAAAMQLLALAESLPQLLQCRQLWQSLCRDRHCSATQRAKLHTLLRQYLASHQCLPSAQALQSCSRIEPLIEHLESSIASAPRVYR